MTSTVTLSGAADGTNTTINVHWHHQEAQTNTKEHRITDHTRSSSQNQEQIKYYARHIKINMYHYGLIFCILSLKHKKRSALEEVDTRYMSF